MAKHFLDKTDFVLGIGTSFTISNFNAPMPNNVILAQITNCAEDLNKDYAIDFGAIGDAKLVIRQVIDEVKRQVGDQGRADTRGVIDEVSKAETEADNLEDMLVKKMFEVEDQMKPVDVVFWYQIFEWIGDLADYSKKTGSRLRLMIAQN